METTLAEIWADVLGVDRVGARDNFFATGGDSILSMQVVSRARQAGLRITAKDVFVRQTLADLAAVAVPVADERAADPGGPAPLTPIQRWFFDTHPAESRDHFAMSLTLRVDPGVDPEWLRAALDAVVARHEGLRTRFADQVQEPVDAVDVLAVLATDDPADRDRHARAAQAALRPGRAACSARSCSPGPTPCCS
ncbi:phosphopantetheine-binding protein [Actinokineospora soli]|uniref:Phosphopantetheine-binding protein n=1 Tax=Actinokineospora soli TaxID=1048753 RepID=A0ABW2TMV8_9PSEU